ncbi:MAG: hypothetical protein M1822_002345 [Bathelium mastoideum]|nr:MAG: hypothetical protein M1822_002345 [Bathelium mastoideum]
MDVKGLLAALQGVYSMSASAAVMPWLMPLLRHPTWRNWFWRYTKTFKNMEKLFTHFDSMLQQGEADPEIKQSTPFFEGLYTADGPEKSNFSREDLKAEVITFTAATLDGVAAFVSPFFDNLLQHPDALSRLVDEIRSAERHGQLSSPVVSYDETLKLDYFMACVKETLRCDAPAQTILPRLVSQPGYFFYDGSTFVPGGAEMGASPYIVHRDESIFGPKPSEWVPGRWLEGQMPHEKTGAAFDAYVRRMEKYGMWWGYGDRECAGKFYAQMQTQKLCVELLRRFDIKPTLNRKRFTHKRWAVGMFWDQHLQFSKQA